MKIINANLENLSGLLKLVLAAGCLAGTAAMAATDVTDTVKGQAPIAEGVRISNQTNPGGGLRVGNVAVGDYVFNDVDGDAESGTGIQWLRDGAPIGGATAENYTTVAADVGTQLSVRVTPKTSMAITDPSDGAPITSLAQTVAAAGVGNEIGDFWVPDVIRRNWYGASAHCQAQGGRLPSFSELQGLFLSATSAVRVGDTNVEMCSLHGWPLNGQCGGGDNNYWSSSPNGSGRHSNVSLSNGGAGSVYDSDSYQVACVRRGF